MQMAEWGGNTGVDATHRLTFRVFGGESYVHRHRSDTQSDRKTEEGESDPKPGRTSTGVAPQGCDQGSSR